MSQKIKNKQLRLFISFVVLILFSTGGSLSAQTFSTQSSATFPAPLAPGRVTVGDFDNDNDGDILYQTGANSTVFRFARSNGDGTFTDQAISESPFAGVTLVDHNGSNYHVADFDKDGDQDIWAGVNNTTGSYYRNDNGVFTTQSSSTFPASAVSGRAAAGDFDKDGDADFLYQVGGNGSAFQYARSNGNGTFTDVPIGSSPFAGVTLIDNNATNYHVADFDGDGDVDVWAGVNGATGSYYRNDNGTFTSQSTSTFPAALASGRVIVSDYDTDGDVDILYQTGGNGTAFQYARSNGDGTFAILTQAASPFASVTLADHTGLNYYVEDFDNDDDIDVWTAVAGTSGNFHSKDDAPPALASFTPADDATGVSPTVNITYTFTESVVKGTGNITIVRISDNTVVETIPVSSGQVTGSDAVWVIDPSIILAGSTEYAVKSDAGTFKNASGTIFGGVTLSTAQNFTTATTLNSVSVPADGTYKIGDVITFSVTYSENVSVNTAGGTPFITVTIGSDARNASYVSGSGTAELVFSYTIAAGDFDINGITLESAISLNGGTITNALTTSAPVTLNNVGATTGILVDGIAPTVTSITRSGADNTNATSVEFSVTFSETVSGIDINDFAVTTTGTATGSIASVSAATGTTVSVTVNGVSGNGTLRLDVNASGTGIMDAAGNLISDGYTSGEFYTIVQPSNNTDYFRTITSGDWNSTSTWESSADNVTYHAASLTPDLNANTITILNGHTVTVTASVSIDQTMVDAGGAVTINSGTILTINDGAGWDLIVNGTITVNSGGSMVIKSTATGTASVGNSGGTVTGNVIYERYIPAKRAWRLTTAPLSGANTIREAWQNGGLYAPGVGTFITGPSAVNGLDNSNSYSLKTYNTSTQLLENVTNTNVSLSSSTGSADNIGYFLFVRGDRDPANLTPPNSNTTTISAQGSLQFGTQAFDAPPVAGALSLVGNPYASPVNFNLVTRNNVVKRFYAWDPALNTVGGYVLLDDEDGDDIYSITPATSQTPIIQSGQAVFIQTENAATASIAFEESSKSDISTSAGFRPNNGSSEVLRTNLYQKNRDNTTTLLDGVLSEYNNKYDAAVNIQDGMKLQNINENLSIQRGLQSLSIERSPLANANDTLFFKLSNTTGKNYRFEFVPFNFSTEVSAWLEDTYLNTATPVSITEATTIDFNVTAGNNASANANRFRIVFKAGATLPVTFTTIKAYEKDKGVQVEWNVATESNIKHYEVEKSANGNSFNKTAEVEAAGNNSTNASYISFDANPYDGTNFYRIKAIEKTGEIKYSEVVKVRTSDVQRGISIYPTIVRNGIFNLKLNNQPKGNYTIELFNGLGQKMFTRRIAHLGGSANTLLQLTSVVSKGIYQLKVTNGETRKNLQLIVE